MRVHVAGGWRIAARQAVAADAALLLEHLDTLEYNNEVYMAFFPAVSEDAQEGEPADIDLDDEEYGLIIMKVVEEDGEELLSTLDSDEELDLIYNQFMERLFADEEMED